MADQNNYGAGGSSGAGGAGGLGSTGSAGGAGSTGGLGASGGTSGLGGGATAGGGTSTQANRMSGGGGGGGGLQETLGQVHERADQMLDQAAERLEQVAEQIDTLADSIPNRGPAAKAGTLAHNAADAVEALARFFRDNDVETLERDLGRIVVQRPVPILAAAVVAGFVVGKVLR